MKVFRALGSNLSHNFHLGLVCILPRLKEYDPLIILIERSGKEGRAALTKLGISDLVDPTRSLY